MVEHFQFWEPYTNTRINPQRRKLLIELQLDTMADRALLFCPSCPATITQHELDTFGGLCEDCAPALAYD